MSAQLLQNLQNPSLYDHPIKYFKVIETHISWVLLTGYFAYKIKKPVNFEFLDFSTLAKRRFFCHQEVRANQALSPDIYLAALPLTGSPDQPCFAGEGETFEYAILMREFQQDRLLTELLLQHELTSKVIDDVAILLANFHKRAAKTPPNDFFGTPEQIHEPVRQNFSQIAPLLTDQADLDTLHYLAAWAEKSWQTLYPNFVARKTDGFIRECHGDIHLGNITMMADKPVIFDAIEFNDELRWTDTIADIAFLIMDLRDKHCDAYAYQLTSYYLEYTGDYTGLATLPYYLCYRALVRAKIQLFHLTHTKDPLERTEVMAKCRRYLALAKTFTLNAAPILFITSGLAGSGKSTVAQTLVRDRGVIRLRSDVIRKQLHDLDHLAKSNSTLNNHIYSTDATQLTYERLSLLSEQAINAGYSVVVDATFLKRAQRHQFAELAERLGVRLIILACAAPLKTLEARIELRQAVHRDPSEATLDVLHMQRNAQELLVPEELELALVIDAQDEARYETLNNRVDALLASG